MESVSLNHPGLNSMKKEKRKKKKKDRTKRQVSDFQKPLDTKPQSPAEPRGAKWHQQQELPMLHLHFDVYTDCMTRSTGTPQLSTDCPSHSSRSWAKKKKKKKNLITEISSIWLQPPCLTSSCHGDGLICAFNDFNQPCECGVVTHRTKKKKNGEAARQKQAERAENI